MKTELSLRAWFTWLNSNDVTVFSARIENPKGYGSYRKDGAVDRDNRGRTAPEEQRRIDEVNAGAYWFRAEARLKPPYAEFQQTHAASLSHGHGKSTAERRRHASTGM